MHRAKSAISWAVGERTVAWASVRECHRAAAGRERTRFSREVVVEVAAVPRESLESVVPPESPLAARTITYEIG
jgi:hypothetical protein